MSRNNSKYILKKENKRKKERNNLNKPRKSQSLGVRVDVDNGRGMKKVSNSNHCCGNWKHIPNPLLSSHLHTPSPLYLTQHPKKLNDGISSLCCTSFLLHHHLLSLPTLSTTSSSTGVVDPSYAAKTSLPTKACFFLRYGDGLK